MVEMVRYQLPEGMTNVGVAGMHLIADADGVIEVPATSVEVHKVIQDKMFGLGLDVAPPKQSHTGAPGTTPAAAPDEIMHIEAPITIEVSAPDASTATDPAAAPTVVVSAPPAKAPAKPATKGGKQEAAAGGDGA